MLELADIFRHYGPAYRAKFADRVLPSHLAAMEAIEQCRTEALGGHLYQCAECGELEYSYHSCKNRHCPKCQNEATTRWLEQQRMLLLPVPYFLVTFTLPEELRPVARSHQHCLYNLLFQTSAAALQRLTLDAKYLGGQIGMVGVLHTWTRDLAYHPHVHYLVPGGALSAEALQWLSPRSAAWLVPVRALSKLFRGKFKAALTTAGLCAPVPPQVWHKDWVTHCKPAGTGTEVLTYFAPYIYRIALTNNRLEKLEDGHVTFRFQKRNGVGWKRLTLPAEAFIHRFLQHVLPKGFPKVRSYGFLSPSRRKVLPQIRTLLATCPPPCSCGREHPPPGTSGDTAHPRGGPTLPAMRGGPHLPGACLASQKSTAVMTVRCAQTLGLASRAPWRSTRWSRPCRHRLTGPLLSAHDHSVASDRNPRPPRAHSALHDGLDAVMRPRAAPLRSVCPARRSPSAAPLPH